MTDFEEKYARRLRDWEKDAIDRVRQAVLEKGTALIDRGFNLSATVPQLGADLFELREEIADFGREQVRKELGRQEAAG